MTKQYKPGDIIDGHIKVMSNGSGYDLSKGRISDGPGTYIPDVGQPGSRITPARAPAMAKKSHKARQEKMEARLIKEISAIDPDMSSFSVADDAWAAIVGRQGALAWSAGDRDSTNAAKFVGRALGYLVEKVAAGVQLAVQVNVVSDADELKEDW